MKSLTNLSLAVRLSCFVGVLILISAVPTIGYAKSHSVLTSIPLKPTVNKRPQEKRSTAAIEPLKCTPHQVPDFFWGVTATNVKNVGEITEALKDLKSVFKLNDGELPPIMVRVTFDPSDSNDHFLAGVKTYQAAISEISKHAYVMGEVADSYDWWPYTTAASDKSTSGYNNYYSRTQQLVAAMGDCVQVWEIGNEVNGEWTGCKGSEPDDEGKLREMRGKIGRQITDGFNAVQEYNKTVPPESKKMTAITLLYNSDGPADNRRTCYDKPEYEMRSWVTANISPVVRGNVDYVLLSYYENQKDCPGLNQDSGTFVSNFQALSMASMFPKAKLGFGEIGYKATCPKGDKERVNSQKCIDGDGKCPDENMCIGQAAYLAKYYQSLNGKIIQEMGSAKSKFVGGYFYWYFVQDMTGKNKAGDDSNQKGNRAILKNAMKPSLK